MKNLISLSLVLLLVFPAFVPWMPHNVLRALHTQQELHHKISPDHKKIHKQGHAQQYVAHTIHFDAVEYFSDYLHVDLQKPSQTALSIPSQDIQDIDFAVAADFLLQRYELALIQNRGPPPDDWRRLYPDTPLYLSTQRLRI